MDYTLKKIKMIKVNLNSYNFSHSPSSTWYKTPKHITWEYNTKNNPITFYIDGDIFKGISEKNDGKLKFLWGLESPHFNSGFFSSVINNLDEVLETYEMIFTYNDELVKLHPKFKWVPGNGFWVEKPKIYEKTKLTSMICSDKKNTELQRFRFDYAMKNKDKIDLYGNINNHISFKEEGLIDYMFSVCVENDVYDTYFTEKILDCFATGTIPVYKGTKNIINYFNKNGIIFLDDISLDSLTPELYFSKMNHIKENFERVLPFNVNEDWLYDKYLTNL